MKEEYSKPRVSDEATFVARSGACLSLPQGIYLSANPNKTCGSTNCSYAQGFPSHNHTGKPGNKK